MSCNSAVVLFIWGLNLMQTVHDWELESILLFRELLYSASVRGFFWGGENCLERIWGRFYYRAIPFWSCEDSLGKAFGMLNSQQELNFFIWVASWGEILTMDNLRKRDYFGELGLHVQGGMGRQLIICFFIVLLPKSYGIWPLPFLGFNGWWLEWL